MVTEVLNSVREENWTLGVTLLTALSRLNNFLLEGMMTSFAIRRMRIIVNLASFSKNVVYHIVSFQRVRSIIEIPVQNNAFRILLFPNDVSKNMCCDFRFTNRSVTELHTNKINSSLVSREGAHTF